MEQDTLRLAEQALIDAAMKLENERWFGLCVPDKTGLVAALMERASYLRGVRSARPAGNGDGMKTVRVRICVVVDEAGGYNAAGWSNADDASVKDIAIDSFEPKGRERITWVEADVPLPEAEQTVVGEAQS